MNDKSKQKHHIMYMTTNTLNGKIYIGVHNTYNLTDDYMGSGIGIINAIKKYGRKAFERVILEEFETAEDAFSKEREVVNEAFIKRKDTYNMRIGGSGGYRNNGNWTPLRGEKHPFYGTTFSDETRKKLSESHKGKRFSEDHKKKISESIKGEKNGMYGKPKSKETLMKISESLMGEKNPNYGKTKSEETRKKISEAHMGKVVSSSTRQKISESKKGRKYFHNPDTGKRRLLKSTDSIPDGFIIGFGANMCDK